MCPQSLPSPQQWDIPRQLRLLAPKGKALPCHPETPVQDQQPTEGHDVNLQQSVTSQSYVPLKPVSCSHGFTSASSPHPDHTFSNLERTQHSVVAPYTNFNSNRVPPTWANDGSPELARGNLVSGVDETLGLSTQNLLYGNLQLQETIQSRHGGGSEDHWLPMHHALEDAVWAAMAQPTIAVYQSQSFIRFLIQFDC